MTHSTLAALAATLQQTLFLQLQTTSQDGRPVTRVVPVPEGTPGATRWVLRRVDTSSVTLTALQGAFDRHELVRYARWARSTAGSIQAEAEGEDAVPPMEPESNEPQDQELRASADVVFVHAVLMAALVEPTYEEAMPLIRGTAYEPALVKAALHWEPDLLRLDGVADPKA